MQVNFHPFKTEAKGRMVEGVLQETERQVKARDPFLLNAPTHCGQ